MQTQPLTRWRSSFVAVGSLIVLFYTASTGPVSDSVVLTADLRNQDRPVRKHRPHRPGRHDCPDQPWKSPTGGAMRWSAAACRPADRPGDVVSHLAMRSR